MKIDPDFNFGRVFNFEVSIWKMGRLSKAKRQRRAALAKAKLGRQSKFKQHQVESNLPNPQAELPNPQPEVNIQPAT